MLTLIFAPGRGLPLGPNLRLLLELAELGRNNPGLSAQLPVTTYHGEGTIGGIADVSGQRNEATGCVHLRHGTLRICDVEISYPMLLLINGKATR